MWIRLAVLVLVALLWPVGVAAAAPVSTPEPGALLTSAPARVQIAVEERVTDLQILVTDAAGVRRDVGAPAVHGPVGAVDLTPGLAAGSYTVDWRLRDPDGSLRSGTFLFTLAPAVETAASARDTGPTGRRHPTALWLAAGLVVVVGGLALVRSAGRVRR
ncbi:copper resistance CopC family protein [Pseudonocardia xishanensis]|uniref:CopC domain-containing protein n=1 Tax=Pseudonocardia xishanensis TaxID=630995 RepID=A0ABP8RD47_9PSEU